MGELLGESVWRVLCRRKISTCPGDGGQPMHKTLSVVDVTCLGLATTLGTGLHVLLTQAARESAGPAVVLSFLIAAVASCLGGLCYSELASRFPKGGSAYVYAYTTLGEFSGFVIGWAMILEYVIGAALAAKTWSQYLDVVTDGSLWFVLCRPFGTIRLPGFDQHPDVAAAIITAVVCTVLVNRVKLSCVLNNVLVIVCLLVLVAVVLVGIFHMDAENWTAGPGFFPNGVGGIFTGASTCFFAFLGYDIVVSSTGEMIHRSRILPAAISLTFLLGLVACFATSVVITLLVPFSLLDSKGPLLQAFQIRGIKGMEYLVILGASSGMISSVGVSLFALSRLLQSLANDGLLFRCLAHCNSMTGTPWWATISGGILSSAVALMVNTKTLLCLMGMGTMVAFASVSAAVLCLRYGVLERLPLEVGELSRESTTTGESGGIAAHGQCCACRRNEMVANVNVQTTLQDRIPGSSTRKKADADESLHQQTERSHHSSESSLMLPDPRNRDYGSLELRTLSVEFINNSCVTTLSDASILSPTGEPSSSSSHYVGTVVASMMAIMLLMGILTMQIPRVDVSGSRTWTEVLACLLFVGVLVCIVLVLRMPRHRSHVRNGVPCVPLLPICAIWMDLHLMVCLPYTSWLAFLVWGLLGFLVYMGYGIWHSVERNASDEALLEDGEHRGDCSIDQDPSAQSQEPLVASS